MIFARSPEEEALHKNWVSGTYEANVEFSRLLTAHTLTIASESGLPFFHFDSLLQEGNNFGDRLSQSCQKVFSEGYTHVLVIGNDTTQLTTSDLIQAASLQQRGALVLGPSTDGGVYLLGISSSQFQQKILDQVRWKSQRVMDDLLRNAENSGIETVFLSWKNDLDDSTDFGIFIKSGESKSRLGKRLIRLTHTSPSIEGEKAVFHLPVYQQVLSLRGPPST